MRPLHCPVCSKPDIPLVTATCPACGTDLRPLWRVRTLAASLSAAAGHRHRATWLLATAAVLVLLFVLAGYALGEVRAAQRAAARQSEVVARLTDDFARYRQEYSWDRRSVAALRLERDRLRQALEGVRPAAAGEAADRWQWLRELADLVVAGEAHTVSFLLPDSLFVSGTARLTAEGAQLLTSLVERCARVADLPRISVRAPVPSGAAQRDGDSWLQLQRAWTAERQLHYAATAMGMVTVGTTARRGPPPEETAAGLGVRVEVRGTISRSSRQRGGG